jgi:hypothetical protein
MLEQSCLICNSFRKQRSTTAKKKKKAVGRTTSGLIPSNADYSSPSSAHQKMLSYTATQCLNGIVLNQLNILLKQKNKTGCLMTVSKELFK